VLGAALVYGVPLAALLAGAVLGALLGGSDVAAAIGAAVGVIVALAAARTVRTSLDRLALRRLSVHLARGPRA
jgi:positive regulator of sigma E activity